MCSLVHRNTLGNKIPIVQSFDSGEELVIATKAKALETENDQSA